MGVGCGECAPPQKIFFILGSRNAYFGAFSCLSECLLTLLPYCNTSKSRPPVRLPRPTPTFLGWLWLSQSCWSSWQKGHWALASVTRINTFLFTLAFNWHWHYPLPAPLKLRPNGAIQICYYYYGKYVKNLIVANVQTLRDDDCNSHNFSLDGHEYGGPYHYHFRIIRPNLTYLWKNVYMLIQSEAKIVQNLRSVYAAITCVYCDVNLVHLVYIHNN